MSIAALRRSLGDTFHSGKCIVDHPGLVLYRYQDAVDGKSEYQCREKTVRQLSEKIPETTIALYKKAYDRWKRMLQDDAPWGVQRKLSAVDRLFVGLGGASVLEFGVTLHHVYGLPCIPGSTLKGICANYANAVWGQTEHDWKFGNPLHNIMFGKTDDPEKMLSGNAGALDFLDAWWTPETKQPFIEEIVNPHHPDYYASDDPSPPADWDQPIPVKLLAVTGSFLFAIRGPAGWNELAMELLTETLVNKGVGGKTRAGYGRFKPFKKPGGQNDDVILWHKATLTYDRGKQIVKAASTVDGKQLEATTQNQSMVPESKCKIFKKKTTVADVEVSPLGGKHYRIVKIRA